MKIAFTRRNGGQEFRATCLEKFRNKFFWPIRREGGTFWPIRREGGTFWPIRREGGTYSSGSLGDPPLSLSRLSCTLYDRQLHFYQVHPILTFLLYWVESNCCRLILPVVSILKQIRSFPAYNLLIVFANSQSRLIIDVMDIALCRLHHRVRWISI